jgi:UDP-N-acetylmuramyl pentapeptide synthase
MNTRILIFWVVSNPLKALQKLAELHRQKFQVPVIGITGSNGKNHCERVASSAT